MSALLGIALLVFMFIGVPLLLPWVVVKLTSRETKRASPLMETSLSHQDLTPTSSSVAHPPACAQESMTTSLGAQVVEADDSNRLPEGAKVDPLGYVILISAFLRLLGGLAGITILVLLCHVIFVERKIPAGSGYYGPVMFPAWLYIAYAFIGYAFGGERWLPRLRAPFQFLRLIVSFGMAFIMLWFCLVLAKRGFSLFALVWFYPGKVIAQLAATWVPRTWVFGDPTSAAYLPEKSAEGFAVICAYIFWTIAIFLVWEGLRAFRLRSKGGAHA